MIYESLAVRITYENVTLENLPFQIYNWLLIGNIAMLRKFG